MIENLNQFIKKNSLFNSNDSILLAVSGGIDSMVMTDLFNKNKYRIGIAHCNFKLRGNESEKDQDFVKKYAKKLEVEFHTINFNTSEYVANKGISIQMAARELRYDWFNKIAVDKKYTYIAIAHHADDVIETFFINFMRGTGIRGLSGIQVKNNKIIRPLLFSSRAEIEEYASKNSIVYREDSSNLETKYIRNKIRHLIIPEFNKISTSFTRNAIETIELLNESGKVYFDKIVELREDICEFKKDRVYIDIKKLQLLSYQNIILFEILNEYGFNHHQVKDLLECINGESGKLFISESHRLVKDRNKLIIERIKKHNESNFEINENVHFLYHPLNIRITAFDKTIQFKFIEEKRFAFLDASKLKFPLKIRQWKEGDKFKPLGINHFKKLSDFFTNNKFSIIDKENTWLLTSQDEIVWVINHRIDDRYKITDWTQKIFQLELIED